MAQGSGDPQGNAGDPTQGTQTQLVPYSQVLSEYQAAAQTEVDRQLIPQADRDLVRAYFADLGK
ncbi:MAG: hypothetical protein M3Z13_03260 [Candidatus Dormibacteraeota bacterium]|nr:hypothetical protein [Candidatus Dormibacteraeota bacterium]